MKGTESADLADFTRELTALDDRTLALSLDAMSGEIHSSAVQLAAIDGESATDAIRSEVTTRMSQRDAETSGATAWGFDGGRNWFRFRGERNSFDSIGEQDGLFGVRGATGSISGFAIGRDWTRSRRWLFGVGGSFATGRMALSGLSDSTTFSSPRGMAYAGYSGRGWAVDGGVAVARAAYQTTRTLQFTALAPAGGRLLGGVDQHGDQPAVRNRGGAVERSANRRAGWFMEVSTHGWRSPGPIWVERIHRDGRRCAVAVRAGTIDQFAAG